MIPKVIVFDLDGTLTESKSLMTLEMGTLLAQLMGKIPTGVTSGASFIQFRDQFAARIPQSANFSNLYLLPTSGAALYAWTGSDWQAFYEEHLTEEQMADAEQAVNETLVALKMKLPASHGSRIERRQGTAVAFSGLGQEAPIIEKEKWDPDRKKRLAIVDIIKPRLPWAEVRLGGMTTIDITRKGIDKAYGLEKLSKRLHIAIPEMLYVGDALYPGGNDEVVKRTGVPTRAVSGPAETARLIRSFL